MIEKIKTLIANVKTRIMLNKCYNEMESKCIAAFGMCSGKWHILGSFETPYKQCTICRCFRDVRSDKNV